MQRRKGFQNLQLTCCFVLLAGVSDGSLAVKEPIPAPERQRESQGSKSSSPNNTRFLQVNSVADVFWTDSPHAGPLHLDAGLALWTSDYFRGRYGGVPAEIDRLSYRLLLGATVELLEGQPGPGALQALSLSFGNLNFVTDTPDGDNWYTSDRYVGVSAAFEGGWLAGLAYTAYKNPDSAPGVPQDLALTLRYLANSWLGSLQPQLKVVKTVGSGTGWLTQASVTPTFKPFGSKAVTITTPLDVGVGFNGYQGPNVEEGYYAELGLIGSTALKVDTPGRWTFSGGVYLTLRDQSIVDATVVYDDAGHLVPTGFIALSYTY